MLSGRNSRSRAKVCEYEKDRIASKTGKRLEDITLSEVMKNHIGPDDIKISKEMLRAQGQVAKEAGNAPM